VSGKRVNRESLRGAERRSNPAATQRTNGIATRAGGPLAMTDVGARSPLTAHGVYDVRG
jgi:hypothetical protein